MIARVEHEKSFITSRSDWHEIGSKTMTNTGKLGAPYNKSISRNSTEKLSSRVLDLCLLYLCARLFIDALWSPAGKGMTSWLSFVVSNCEFVTFTLRSWVRYGT